MTPHGFRFCRLTLLAATLAAALTVQAPRITPAADDPTTGTATGAVPIGEAAGTTATQTAAGAGGTEASTGTLSAAPARTPAAPARPVFVNALPTTQTKAEAANLLADENGIKLSFRGAELDTVLTYLGQAAGFVIVRDTPVTGKADVYSPRPVTKDEAVDLLNTALSKNGFIAIRNDRTLTVVKRDTAPFQLDTPIVQGVDPDKIPKKETIVTQIMPIRSGNAIRMLENLRPLLSPTAIVSANESSNAILMTDSQVNIRRIAMIIKALDTTISDISKIHVVMLTYADATTLADVVNKIFATPTTGATGLAGLRGAMRGRGGFPGATGATGAPAAAGTGETGQSEARQAASRVQAVPEDRTNSIVISCPDDVFPTVEAVVRQLDVDTELVKEVKVFQLFHSNADEMATLIMNSFSSTGQTTAPNRGGAARGGIPVNRGGTASSSQAQSQRQAQANSVVATPDSRTNSIIVNAGPELMRQIEVVVQRLDADPAKTQTLRAFQLTNGNPDEVAAFLATLFPAQAGAGRSTQNRGATANRTATTNRGNNAPRNTGRPNSSGSGVPGGGSSGPGGTSGGAGRTN